MKGQHGVSMQGIEYAPKKKGNVKCCECRHLIFKVTGKNKGTRADMCNHYCEIKKQARYYTSRCYCRQYEPQAEAFYEGKIWCTHEWHGTQTKEALLQTMRILQKQMQ